VPHDSVAVFLIEAEGRIVQTVGYRDPFHHQDEMKSLRFIGGQMRDQRVMQTTGAPVIIPDVSAYEGWVIVPENEWIRSYLGVPILFKGEVIGFLSLSSARTQAFAPRDAERLQSFANYAAIAIENARLYEKVQKLALTDTLTGAYNRAHFEAELGRMEPGSDYPVSVIVADLDDMKLTNDRLGHVAGDELLKRCVVLLQSAFRARDILARIGGDEFAVLLPKTDAAIAVQIVSRVNARLANHNDQCPDLPVHLSLGTATAEQGAIMQAFILADQRMYEDKALHKSR